MLEYSLIKQHQPRFNIRLRDDKSYPFLAVTMSDEWPRPMVMRGSQAQGRALLRAVRPRLRHPRDARPAAAHVPDPHLLGQQVRAATRSSAGRACCSTSRSARARASARSPRRTTTSSSQELLEFLDGDTDTIVERLETEMREAADELEFERAARLRDRLDTRAQGHREAADGGRPRRGHRRDRHRRRRPRGGRPGVLRPQGPGRRAQGLHRRQGRGPHRPASWSTRILEGLYDDTAAARHAQAGARAGRVRRPRAVRARGSPSSAGSTVTIRVPQRGDKRDAAGDGHPQRHARSSIRHRLRRAADHNSRAQALNELQDALGLPEAPLRIECYDMSHIQGSDYVGSMVVMEDGLPKKREYRRFKIREVDGQRRLRGHGGGAHPPPHQLPGRAGQAGRASGASSPTRRSCCWSTAARASSSVAVRVLEELGLDGRDPGRVAGQAVRGGLRARARPTRSASRASPRRSTCCSGSATRPTGSPSRSTASCGASA